MPDSAAAAPSPAAKILFGKYEIGRLLGRGASAKVYHARHLPTGHSVAIKIFPKPRPSSSSYPDDTSAAVLREISALRRLRHRHIIRLHEVLASRSKIYLVLEFAKGGELFSRVTSCGHLPEDQSRRLFRQLLSAVAFCHARGVFHRDLKPENLLLDDAGDLKVSDFGLSSVVSLGALSSGRLLQTLCGTPAYVAPELLMKKGYDGAKVDVWSCGVVLFVLNAGYLPFNDPNLMNMYRKIYAGQFRCPRWTSADLRSLLGRLLDPNPDSRITVEGILHEPWFKKGGFDQEKRTAMMRPLYDSDDEISFAGAGTLPTPAATALKLKKDLSRELNAFDIISLGLDLSGLFDRGLERERFTSAEPAEVLLDRIEEVGRREGLVVRKKGEKSGSEVVIEGQNGNLIARIDFYRLNCSTLMVEAETAPAVEDFWVNKLGPVLKGSDQGSARETSI